MQVQIIETGAEATINAIDAASGCDWTRDLVGNHGAFSDGQFSEIEDTGVYLCAQSTYDWWAAVVDNLNLSSKLVQEAKSLGLWSNDVEREYQSIGACDLDDHAAACVDFLNSLIVSED